MAKNRYSTDHEYVSLDGDTGVVGISDYAQEQLGEVVYVELPAIGTEVVKGQQVAVVESVKAASEIYVPISGLITDINKTLEDEPELINKDPLGSGWLFKIKMSDPSEADSLMDEEAYQIFKP